MKVCPICEGYTASELPLCGTCGVPLVDTSEAAWARRDSDTTSGSPWLGLVIGGKYRITGILGRGGMGTVYGALHEFSLAPVALKILNPRFAQRPDYRETLLEEARKGSLLRGDNVSRVLDVGETPEGAVFIAMELVEGETLQEWLRREQSLPPAIVIELLIQLCVALEEAHGRGIVHRDLTPRNIMIEPLASRFRLKVLDFGIAHVQDTDSQPADSDRTASSRRRTETWVNPPYTSPEVLRGEAGNAASDLYSLGVIAFVALSGELPHGGTTLNERITAVLEEDPRPLVVPKGTPRRLVQLVHQLTRKDPAARPASATAVREELEALRRPHGLLLRSFSVLVFLAGLVSFALQLGARDAPYLGASLIVGQPGSAAGRGTTLNISTEAQKPQLRRFEDLRQMKFEASGFDLDDLVLEVGEWGPGGTKSFELGGRLEDGKLILDDSYESWGKVLHEVQRLRYADSLSFRFRLRSSRRSLGWANVIVDYDRPTLEVEPLDRESHLRLATKVRLTVADDTGIDYVEYSIEGFDTIRDPALAKDHPKSIAGATVEIGKQLAAITKTKNGTGNARVIVRAVDLLGRRSERGDLTFVNGWDLSVPEIVQVGDRNYSAELTVAENRCKAWIQLADKEPLLTPMVARLVDNEWKQVLAEVVDDSPENALVVEFDPGVAGDQVELQFRVRDHAGNESNKLGRRFMLHRLDLGSQWLDPSSGVLDRRTTTLYVGTKPVALRYRCNPTFTPSVKPGTKGVIQLQSKPGLVVLEVPPEKVEIDGRTIEIQHRTTPSSVDPRTASLKIEYMPEPPHVKSSALALAGKYACQLPGFVKGGDGREDTICLAPDLLSLEGPKAKGRIYRQAQDGSWREVVGLADLEQSLRQGLPLKHGRNRFAVIGSDVLGRPLVAQGTMTAARDGRIVIADLRHDMTAPAAVDVLVEFGQTTRIVVDDDQQFGPSAEIVLELPARRLRGKVRALPGGRSEYEFSASFETIAQLCRWSDVDRSDFVQPGRKPEQRAGTLHTPAGEFKVNLTFRPVASLLRATTLGAVLGTDAGEVSKLELVPFLAPARDRAISIGVVDKVHAKGTIVFDQAVEVRQVAQYYLSQTEISRAAYQAFVIAAPALDDNVKKELVHAADPLHLARLTPAGLAPDTTVFGGKSLAYLVTADGARPITGVNYFQARAFARWLGWRLAKDPDMFRLPYAVELEWAALGRRKVRNGMHVPQMLRGRSAADVFRRYRTKAESGSVMDPGRWPLDQKQLAEIGDYADGFDGRVYGLDFGVREWVEDLPIIPSDKDSRYHESWIESHTEHQKQVERFARTGRLDGSVSLRRLGVVKGLGFGEPAIEGRDPALYLEPTRFGDSSLLGVKRTENVPRDGIGRPGRNHPSLRMIGFRLCGRSKFIARARGAMR